MGCNLEDHDWINQRKYPGATPDSSFLMRIQQDNVIKGIVTKNTALLGSAIATRKSAKQEKYDDVIYINVIPPLTVIEQNVKGRLEEGVRRDRWSNLEEVIKRRQESLLFAIKDEVLVEPLFATFQEGLEFCINTYNTTTLMICTLKCKINRGKPKLLFNSSIIHSIVYVLYH